MGTIVDTSKVILHVSVMSVSSSHTHTLKYSLYTQNLPPDVAELYELSHLAGITTDPNLFKILIDLLRLNVAPLAIDRMLKSMCLRVNKQHQRSIDDNSRSKSATTPALKSKLSHRQ